MAGNGARATTLKPKHIDNHCFLLRTRILNWRLLKDRYGVFLVLQLRKILMIVSCWQGLSLHLCMVKSCFSLVGQIGGLIILFSALLSRYCYLKVCIYSHGNFEMSFWQSSTQADLSVTGTSSSRHQRPPSGRRGRPSSAPRGGSTKSHIFGVSDTPRQEEPKQNARSSFQGNTSSVHTTPEAPRPSSAHAPNNTGGHRPVNNVRMLP